MNLRIRFGFTISLGICLLLLGQAKAKTNENKNRRNVAQVPASSHIPFHRSSPTQGIVSDFVTVSPNVDISTDVIVLGVGTVTCTGARTQSARTSYGCHTVDDCPMGNSRCINAVCYP